MPKVDSSLLFKCAIVSAGLSLLLCTGTAFPQNLVRPDTSKIAAIDSTRSVDSLRMRSIPAVDSTRSADSLRVRFIPALGSLRGSIDSSSSFYSSQFLWTDARYFGELFWKMPGFFLRDLGEPAKPGQLNAWGVDWRGIAVLMDGRPMNDPITGTMNLYDIPMEFVEQVEDYDGVQSSAQSWNAPGATLNFVTHQYNTLHPITKIRFIQAPNNNLMTDGLFSQNLLRGLNIMFGFQRLVSDGRFNGVASDLVPNPQGSLVDNWNVRTRLRYNASKRLNISLTDFYTKNINGLNGGIDISRTADPTNEVAAYVNSPNGLETVSRRDVSVLAVGKFFDDSTAATSLNAYYTNFERDFKNPGSEFNALNIVNSHHAQVRGIRLQQSFESAWHRTQVGAQWEHSQYSSNGFSDTTVQLGSFNGARRDLTGFFFSTSLHPIDLVSVDLNGRTDKANSESATSYGIGLTVRVIDPLDIFGGVGQTFRFPTFQESSWADSTIERRLPIGKEKHHLVRAGVNLRIGDAGKLSITGFDRRVDDAILFQPTQTVSGSPAVQISNVSQVHTRGAAASFNLNYGVVSMEGSLLYSEYTEADTVKQLSPRLLMTGELSYRNKFFKNALDLKIGARGQFASRQRGMSFNPQLMLFDENNASNIGQWTRLDLFAILRIGDAYIALSYENVLDATYLITPVYPMPNRMVKFSINWQFSD